MGIGPLDASCDAGRSNSGVCGEARWRRSWRARRTRGRGSRESVGARGSSRWGAAREMGLGLLAALGLVIEVSKNVEVLGGASIKEMRDIGKSALAGAPLGSRAAALNHHAAAFPLPAGADLSRSALVAPLLDLPLSFLRVLTNFCFITYYSEYLAEKKHLGGLLILLPRNISAKNVEGNNDDKGEPKNVLAELEKLLMHEEVPSKCPASSLFSDQLFKYDIIFWLTHVHYSMQFPVYFAFHDDNLDNLLADIRKIASSGQPASASTGGYKLVVPSAEPKKVSSPTISNIQGWLPGSKGEGDAEQLPTIAIVANYDTFGAAPALSVGSDSNGSGAVALLEIARIFSRLYSSPKTRGKFNLLFGLTSGGPYNYNGTSKWLRSFDQRVRESIDYAICLNSVGSWSNDLWMHVSKPPENPYIKQIFEDFSDVSKEMGISVGIKHKKINVSNSRVAWEHEQFSRFRVTALTLSELSTPPEFLESTGGLYDTRESADVESVMRTVKLVSESLAELSEHTTDVHVQNDVLDGMFTFYDATKSTLNVYQVASVTFDLLFLLVLGSYLIVLFSFLVITTRGLDDLINIFRRPPSRKVKGA
ncbi:Nicalin-1 [Triticum urartu]|uniref:Nicalin-1 n=1 Tax=Triticum urartu TaxID=4572 RepID=M8ASR6_TRIUA|nr:Nicalin-1 [Triticum urartu]